LASKVAAVLILLSIAFASYNIGRGLIGVR
jgi:hypothetical protein